MTNECGSYISQFIFCKKELTYGISHPEPIPPDRRHTNIVAIRPFVITLWAVSIPLKITPMFRTLGVISL
jgi:hypothetical protein